MSLLDTGGANAAGNFGADPANLRVVTTNSGWDSRPLSFSDSSEFAVRSVADRFGLPLELVERAAVRGKEHGTGLYRELLSAGLVDEEELFRDAARLIGVPFVTAIDPDRLIIRDRDLPAALTRLTGHRPTLLESREGGTSIVICPHQETLGELRDLVRRTPELARRLRVIPPRRLREALVARASPQFAETARDALFSSFPELSARIIVNAWQGAAVGAGVVLLPAALLWAPLTTMLILHAFFSLFFFSCVCLRLAAAWGAHGIHIKPLKPVTAGDMPVYTILVALYKEAEIVPDLLLALGRVIWPRSKLEIKLVCEADDRETIEAIRAQPLRPCVEIVEVPRGGPRTKPKALAYALQMSAGEYVALYDAEDRPHPYQLVEAWQRFSETDGGLACLQAPLVVGNWRNSLLPRLFAFEYAALFRGILPFLSRNHLMFPLGGTSNHFRKAALEEVCGWDPYNVTEDADLGLRLHRFGYRTETITHPTYEDAPENVRVWMRQRTRWFKGYLLTWLVHMRNPRRLMQDLGIKSFLVTQIIFAGMVASALVHPLIAIMLVGVLAKFAWMGSAGMTEAALLAIDAVNLACGYTAFLLLGERTLHPQERPALWKVVLATPVYWMMMSAAAWRAVCQLYSQPHLWEKTPHPRRVHGPFNPARSGSPGPRQ